jgi:hypothetical protein
MKEIAFSVPIFKYKVQNWDIKKKKLLELFNIFQHKIVGNVITSSIDIKTNILSEEIELFEKELGFNLSATVTWFQQYHLNMDHSVHTHGPYGFSSVCYIEYDKENHDSTIFISPFGNNINGELDRYSPDVEEGDIIFFPSNLFHYVPVNLSKITRTIISSNFLLKNEEKNEEKNKGILYN